MGGLSYLVRKGQGEVDLVGRGLRIASALDGGTEGRGTSPQSRAGKTEGVHDGEWGGGECWRRGEKTIEVHRRAGCFRARDWSALILQPWRQ